MNIHLKFYYRYKKYIKLLRIILFKKPLLIPRIIYNYFRILVFKERVVRKIEIGITFDCQCNCAKCSSIFMRDVGREVVTPDELTQFGKDIIKLGVVHLNLTGGEPLLAERFFEIVKSLQPHKVLITVNTNGLLLSDRMIDMLEQAGVDIIKISIDSPIAEEHDKSRGYVGCFSQAIKALSYIKQKRRILAQISTVCIKENLNSERIWKLVKMANDYNALLGLTIPAASGRWMNAEGILLGEQEREVLKKLIRIPHVIRDTDEAYLRSHCPAGSEELYLTCYGDVIPCPLIQISFGNIKNERIGSIWKKMSDFKRFKHKQKFGCLAGEDRDFIKKYLTPLKSYSHLPLAIENHPANADDADASEKDT